MEFTPKASLSHVVEDRTYEFNFPNGAPAKETLEALSLFHNKILETAKAQQESLKEKDDAEAAKDMPQAE